MASTVLMFLIGVSQAQPPGGPQPNFIAALNSMQEVPANYSTARGSCKVKVYNLVYLDLSCEYSNLTTLFAGLSVHWKYGQNDFKICGTQQIKGSSGTIDFRCGYPYGIPFNPEPLLKKQMFVEIESFNYPDGEIRGQIKNVTFDSDVDGDGRSDAFIYRGNEAKSYTLCSLYDMIMTHQFESFYYDSKPFLADFDGDGIADHSFIRTGFGDSGLNFIPNTDIYTIYVQSRDNTLRQIHWGNAAFGDIRAYGDYDGDAQTDIAVFRPSEGVWHILQSSNNQPRYEVWGMNGDRPCPADYDKDGKTDLCVVRNDNAQIGLEGQLSWYIRRSLDNQWYKIVWGLSTDTLFPENPVDVDADGAADLLVMRVENGQNIFYALRSSDNSWLVLPWGLETDGVRLGDFDGDGKTDFAALRNIEDQIVWFINQSSNGQTRIIYWGKAKDQ